jgi:hypothetical protein
MLFFFALARRVGAAGRPSRAPSSSATVAIYLVVWLYFNFVSLYGYAIFKMASWLQFLFMPVVACGLVRIRSIERPPAPLDPRAHRRGGPARPASVAANLVATTRLRPQGPGA